MSKLFTKMMDKAIRVTDRTFSADEVFNDFSKQVENAVKSFGKSDPETAAQMVSKLEKQGMEQFSKTFNEFSDHLQDLRRKFSRRCGEAQADLFRMSREKK